MKRGYIKSKKTNRNNKQKKEGKNMAVLTADCDVTFSVSKEKTEIFLSQKKNMNTEKKVIESAEKITQKIKIVD